MGGEGGDFSVGLGNFGVVQVESLTGLEASRNVWLRSVSLSEPAEGELVLAYRGLGWKGVRQGSRPGQHRAASGDSASSYPRGEGRASIEGSTRSPDEGPPSG
jgi:hypothetical protein